MSRCPGPAARLLFPMAWYPGVTTWISVPVSRHPGVFSALPLPVSDYPYGLRPWPLGTNFRSRFRWRLLNVNYINSSAGLYYGNCPTPTPTPAGCNNCARCYCDQHSKKEGYYNDALPLHQHLILFDQCLSFHYGVFLPLWGWNSMPNIQYPASSIQHPASRIQNLPAVPLKTRTASMTSHVPHARSASTTSHVPHARSASTTSHAPHTRAATLMTSPA